MRRIAFFTMLLICCYFRAGAQDTLLLFHPTAYNLQVLQHLIDEGVFSMDGYHLLGVYHELETYDYEQAEAYIAHHQTDNFSLHKIAGLLHTGDLFGGNACTEQYKHLFSISNGALFMGGPDIPPAIYNETVHLLTYVTDPFRHYCEASYLFHLLGGTQDPDWKPYMELKEDYLISGICLGMQTMNVATGGTMIQDIPTELYGIWSAEELLSLPPDQMHRNYADMINSECNEPTSYHFHRVKLKNRSYLIRKTGFKKASDPLVLSSHHQAVEHLGNGWVVAAQSMDGKVIEAIEHEQYPFVFGVQFHPEKPGLFDPSILHPSTCNSFVNFEEVIKNTDSFSFHMAYWQYLTDALQKNKKK
ncbi:MAG: gamma-glutamyl-gamma-aminobutyrate hydrolase family protein [Bacteroidales bacterium]|nr:gamma-glutamyl-gamma-aminobutyrate hydrolase family protein [Bacteroidales bacterium]